MNCRCDADCSLDGLVVTEAQVALVEGDAGDEERLRAFATVAFNGAFVVRDLRVIEGPNGLFVSMPSRKIADRCDACGSKNRLTARYCNHCGWRLDETRAPRGDDGRAKLHADTAHPIHAQARRWLSDHVLEAYYDAIDARRDCEVAGAYAEAS